MEARSLGRLSMVWQANTAGQQIIRHILYPNEEIAKGFETVQLLTLDGEVLNGFVIEDNDASITLGVASDDGKGKQVKIDKEDIEDQKSDEGQLNA